VYENYFAGTSSREIAVVVAGAAFLAALSLGAILTSWMCRIGWRTKMLDRPDGCLKCHTKATPTLGGVPLFVAVVSVLSLLVLSLRYGMGIELGIWWQSDISMIGVFTAAIIIFSLGVCDDLHHVRPHVKLLFQTVASMTLIVSGVLIDRCNFFGVFDLSFGILAVPFTLFWLVGSCNAFNFIDGMDGLASGIGIIISSLLAVLGLLNGMYFEAIMALTLAGGLSAILIFNLHPARIFLGDSGSQVIGLFLGALAIRVAMVEGVFSLPSAGLILSVPVMDTLLSILRRYSVAASPARGDRRHIHHCLHRMGLTVPQLVMVLWLVVFIAGIMGIVFCYAKGTVAGWAALGLVVLEMYLGVRLGCLNIGKLLTRLGITAYTDEAAPISSVMDDVCELEKLWEHMKPMFEQMHLDRVILTLEGVSPDGQPKYETYRWVRSEVELLGNRWTKKFPLEGYESRMATLQLESAEQFNKDKYRIDWLLQQISDNMRNVGRTQKNRPTPVEKKETVAI